MTQVLQFTESIVELITACHWDFSHSITNADLFREGAKNMPTGTFFIFFHFFVSFSLPLLLCWRLASHLPVRMIAENIQKIAFVSYSCLQASKKSSCVIKNILWELIVLIIFIFILIVQCYIVCVLIRMREEKRCNEEHKCDGRLHVKILHVQLSVGISLSHSTDMGLLLLNGFYGEIPSSPFGHLLSHPLPKKM